jgi:uncharacterized protein (DUF1697 family)
LAINAYEYIDISTLTLAGTKTIMALVVFLRGVNIGGHRTFRPTILAKQLRHFDAVNIGAAGTFVIWQPVTRTQLRAELARRLPFDTEVIICRGLEILELMLQNPFARRRMRLDTVHFVSILSRRPRLEPSLPASFPSRRRWLLNILSRKDRFVFGLYRRRMNTIRYFGEIDRLFGARITSRNWNTITEIATVLGAGGNRSTEEHRKNAGRHFRKANREWSKVLRS